ncbi:hypothetical protein [Streptomyces sp. TE33382]
MNQPTMRDEFRPVSAALQMPQQTPPVDRAAFRTGTADSDASGVEASGLLELAIEGIGKLLG